MNEMEPPMTVPWSPGTVGRACQMPFWIGLSFTSTHSHQGSVVG